MPQNIITKNYDDGYEILLFMRCVALIILILSCVICTKKLEWVNTPEAHIGLGVGLIFALVLDGITGLLLLGATLAIFTRVNKIKLGNEWFQKIMDGVSDSHKPEQDKHFSGRDTKLPPFVTKQNLEDAQSNVVNAADFNKGYKPSSYEVGYDAQGLDTKLN